MPSPSRFRVPATLSTAAQTPPTPALTPSASRLGWSGMGLAALCLAFFMVILDTTIVNVALPTIQTSLHGTVTSLQWVVDGFTLPLAGLLLAAGSVADRWGSRRIFRLGLLAFTVGSGFCALAPDIGLLVSSRLFQGVGAAMILPASLALIAGGIPDAGRRARALGIWAATAGIATAVGPLVGGTLVALAGWRAIFVVNLPVGVFAWWLSGRFLTETRTRRAPLDLPGQLLGASALALVTLALVEAGSWSWTSRQVLGLGLAGMVLGGVFVTVERRVRTPMLPRRLFQTPAFTIANVVGFALNFGIYGQVFVLSLYFQQIRGFTALDTGVALLPFAVMTVIGPVFVGRVVGRVGTRLPMVVGQVLAGGGSGVLALAGPHTSYGNLVWGLVALGMGMALTMPSMTAAAVQVAPQDIAGVASGLLNTARQIGGAIGVAVLGSLVAQHFMEGMHVGLTIVAGVFFAGAMTAARYATASHDAGPQALEDREDQA